MTGIYEFHSSLEEVIWVQIVVMSTLLLSVAVPFLRKMRSGSEDAQIISESRGIRRIRSVAEDEVIAEFLKNDFQNPEFKSYQQVLRDEVMAPDFSDALENARRRALLFIRHGRLWRELPEGTEWHEVELTPADLQRIRVFPRAQWRKLARGNFAITDVVHGIAQGDRRHLPEAKFLAKIDGLGEQIRQGTAPGAVLLIGLNENGPFTILDGNHRLVSAMLISAQAFRTLRFFCGLSPKMTNCCWYATNLATLFRYGTNLLRHAAHDPEAELAHLLQSSDERASSQAKTCPASE